MDIHIDDNGSGAHEIWAIRDDSVVVQVAAAASRSALPHELFHYACEDSLSLAWGYWDCIAKGAIFDGMAVRSGIAREAALAKSGQVGQEAGPRADDAEFFVAALETAFDANLEGDVEAAKGLVSRTWAHLDCPPLETVDMVRLKQRVADLTRQWLALRDGESMTLTWPSAEAGKLRLID